MNIEEQKEILKDWLAHPGTRLMAEKIEAEAERMLKEYDTADETKFRRIQTARWFLTQELPRVIETVMNEGKKPKKWFYQQWFKRE